MTNKAAIQGRKTRSSSRRRIKSRAKSQQAVRLREAGATHAQIAEQLGYANESGAYKAVTRYLAETAQDMSETTESVRQLEVQRLDRMLFTIYPQVLGGDLSAIQTAMRIGERRSSLLGLDAPKQYEAKIRIDILSWNEAVRDFLDIYRELHGNAPEAKEMVERIDSMASDRFSGVL